MTTRNKLYELTEMEKAYLAGLMDGEGCVFIGKHKGKNNRSPAFSLHVIISQADKNFLEYWISKTGMGVLINQPRIRNEWKERYCWLITSRDASLFLEYLLNLLMIKKEQAEIAIAFQKTFDQYIGGYGYIVPRYLIAQRENFRLLLKQKKKETIPEDSELIYEELQAIKDAYPIQQFTLF